MKRNKRGISLIALIITIIVIIILAAIVITMSLKTPEQAKYAKFTNDISSIQEAVTVKYGEIYAKKVTQGKNVTRKQVYEEMVKANTATVGEIAVYEIDETKLKYDLPEYQNTSGTEQKWYLDTETGTVYIVPGYEYDGEVYTSINGTESGNITEEPGNDDPVLLADGSWNETKGVNTPQLMTGMTGIYWDASGNEVEVTAENQDNWYDYESNEWANAKTEDGSYWVWIPRYAYQIKSGLYTSTAGEIDVEFLQGTTNLNAEGETISTSYPTVTGDSMADFVVHPAFVDGTSVNFRNGEWDENVSGFWVAKYEAGFQASSTDASDAEEVINADDTIVRSSKNYTKYYSNYKVNAIDTDLSTLPKMSYPVFKPLTYSYNNITIGDIYTLSRALTESGNIYGLSSSKTDSHMMKNSEWGAVAYLTQSKYGRNGTEITINSKSLNNLHSKYIYAITGYGKTNANNTLASSTGNISGVFDLSGACYEYTAGYIPEGSNLATYGNTFASTTETSNKYATVYKYDVNNSSSDADNYVAYKNAGYGFGDAILETSTSGSGATSWNIDLSYFVDSSGPFFVRGGYFSLGTLAGEFSFLLGIGGAGYDVGFRPCLIAE